MPVYFSTFYEKFRLEDLQGRHDGNEAHPDDYAEIPKCKHCSKNCTRAVVVTMGKKAHQDEVFKKWTTTLTENHGEGVLPSSLDYMTQILWQGGHNQEFAKEVYEALKDKHKICVVFKDNHTRLLWGIAMNDCEGKITKVPGFWVSDPAEAGTQYLSAADIREVCK